MVDRCGSKSLFIIPCSAAKYAGGNLNDSALSDPLKECVSSHAYAVLLETRARVIDQIQANEKFQTFKYKKNVGIMPGPDFGGSDASGRYLPAITRYAGTLYSVEGLKVAVDRLLTSDGYPKLMILSALYGPLHPLSPIQDYNLMMSDLPARQWQISFPGIMESYVRQNAISRIVLFVGTSTAYFRTAKAAIANLASKSLEVRSIQYHVENGSTRNTPLQHGRRLLDDLAGVEPDQFRSKGIVEHFL
jgi:hypothetical protein